MFHDKHRATWHRAARRDDRSPAAARPAVSSDDALEDLVRTLHHERGFASATLRNHQRTLRPFLAWLTDPTGPVLSRQARDRRAPGRAGSHDRARSSRSRRPVVPLQHRCAGQRDGGRRHPRSRPAIGWIRFSVARRQGRQDATLSALAHDHDVAAGAGVGTVARRARVPQPAASVHHAVCRPCDRRAVRDGGRHCLPVNRQESDQPARHSAHHGHAPVARGRGHQHDPRVARSRLDRHDQRKCRSGSGDEGPDARCVWILQLWEGGQASLAGRPVLDAVPPQPVRSAGYVT
jgi:hypothetical protein